MSIHNNGVRIYDTSLTQAQITKKFNTTRETYGV